MALGPVATSLFSILFLAAAPDAGAPAAPDAGVDAGAEAGTLSVTLRQTAPLKLVMVKSESGGKEPALAGVLEVEIRNDGAASVALEHLDVQGLVFVDLATGTERHLIHPCDCPAIALGEKGPPDRRFELAPGAAKTLVLDDWQCDSVWTPPPPGKYALRYRVLRAAPARAARLENGGKDLHALCAAAVASPDRWTGSIESAPIEVTLGRGKAPR